MFGCFFLYICTGCGKKSCCKIMKKYFYQPKVYTALTREEEIGTRSGRAGPSFSVRPEKEAKGAVLHGTSAAERSRHVKSRSANLPKLDASHRLKHMGRFVFALRAKIPSRATQSDSAGAASASGKLFRAQSLFSVSFFVKPIFAHRMLLRSRSFESPSCSRASLFSAFVRPL